MGPHSSLGRCNVPTPLTTITDMGKNDDDVVVKDHGSMIEKSIGAYYSY
jgi:hypothetical protein